MCSCLCVWMDGCVCVYVSVVYVCASGCVCMCVRTCMCVRFSIHVSIFACAYVECKYMTS